MTQTTRTTTTTARTPKQPRTPRPVFKPRIRVTPIEGVYWCESERHPGTGHQTSCTSCTCPAGKFGKRCKHIRLVRAYDAWRRQQRALAAAAAGPGTLLLPGNEGERVPFGTVRQMPAAQPSGPVQPSARLTEEWAEDSMRVVPAVRPAETGLAALWAAFE